MYILYAGLSNSLTHVGPTGQDRARLTMVTIAEVLLNDYTLRHWSPAHPCGTLRSRLQVIVVITDGHILSLLQLPFVLLDESSVNLDLRCLGKLAYKLQVGLIGEAASQPQEGLLEVVVASCTQIVVLQVPLAMELDVFCLHLTILHINLVPDQNNRDVLTHSNNVSVPVGHVLVSDS